ncbi:MAG TPA: hypothetical protein VFZ09_30955 [Archangium sp.]|uniref:hypothetical protein n=1 Tax=Archangium sp. TaxID=1872627 RepID=UPI002E30A632|nr:hypothetical protein [Archangium sp.]HEX5750687.1 hypothetical protein [Archangium sp.]
MQGESLETQDFSTWDGSPFFEGHPEEGRHVYIVKSREEGTFTAYGALDDQQQVIFIVQGTLAQLDRFVAQVKSEGARVTRGLPPFDTNTGGDKANDTSRPGFVGDPSENIEARDFSTWDGRPFFEGYPKEGRHIYIVRQHEQGGFIAHGALDGQQQVMFGVRGTHTQLDRFVAQVKSEGARVTHGQPPFNKRVPGGAK